MNDRSTPAESVTRRDVLVAGVALAAGASGAARAAAQAEEIIDIHPHLLTKDDPRYPPHPLGGSQSDWSRERSQPFEKYVAEANAASVSKAACVQVSTFYGVDNSYLCDSIARDPKRFTQNGCQCECKSTCTR